MCYCCCCTFVVFEDTTTLHMDHHLRNVVLECSYLITSSKHHLFISVTIHLHILIDHKIQWNYEYLIELIRLFSHVIGT